MESCLSALVLFLFFCLIEEGHAEVVDLSNEKEKPYEGNSKHQNRDLHQRVESECGNL